MQIRDLKGNLIIDLSVFNGGLLLGGADGTITLFISDEDSEGVSEDKCVYDLELIAPGGDVIPLVAGTFTFQNQITVV
jgi:hypothetical protein